MVGNISLNIIKTFKAVKQRRTSQAIRMKEFLLFGMTRKRETRKTEIAICSHKGDKVKAFLPVSIYNRHGHNRNRHNIHAYSEEEKIWRGSSSDSACTHISFTI